MFQKRTDVAVFFSSVLNRFEHGYWGICSSWIDISHGIILFDLQQEYHLFVCLLIYHSRLMSVSSLVRFCAFDTLCDLQSSRPASCLPSSAVMCAQIRNLISKLLCHIDSMEFSPWQFIDTPLAYLGMQNYFLARRVPLWASQVANSYLIFASHEVILSDVGYVPCPVIVSQILSVTEPALFSHELSS